MITAKCKAIFFDKQAVKDLLDDSSRQALSRAGAFIRRTAKSSIRTRKAISSPGSPPSSHAGHLRRLIFFAYDAAAKSVVIGPMRFKEGQAPSLLEFGGSADRTRKGGRKFTAAYRPRPFMGPALAKELPKLSSHWASSVKGG